MGAIETLNNIRAALIDRVTLDAVGADGYPVFTQFRHNAQAAIKALSEAGGGVAVSALYHPEIGDIDLRWGQTSDDPRSKGMGLAKIIKWHPEVLHDLQGFISGLTVHQSHKKKGEIHLTDGMNARAGIKLEWNQKSAHWLVTAYVKKDTSVSKRTPAVLDGANGLTTASPNNAGDFIVGFEDIDVNTATLDSAMDAGIGVMARLKLVGELAKIKIGLKDAGDGPLAAMKRLKAISRANQIRVELGAAAKIPEAEKPLLVPSGIKGESAPMPDPYATIETRPGTTEEQRQVGRDALFALFERVNRNQSTEDRPQLIGNRLIADFKTSGAANLVGQAVQDSDDMAAIAQVYRDPRFETFRAIFVDDGGKIVGESSYTSRMPGCVHFPKNTDIAEDIRADMDRFGATGIYLMHNHPSGKSDPSSADIHATRYIGEKIPAMKGHIVIDHNEYTVIDSAGRHQTRPIENTGFHATPSAPHPLLGTAISTPDSLVEAANQLKDQAEKSHVVIMTNVKGEVNLVFSLPPDMLEGIDTDESAKARLKAWLRKIGRNTGTGLRAFLVWNEKSGAVTTEQESTMSRLINGGVFTDIVYDSSKVMSANNRYYSFSPRNLTDPLRDGIKTTSSLPTNPLQKYIDFLRGVIAGGHNTDAGDSLADRLLEAGEACLVDPLLDDLVAQATEAAFEIVSAPFSMA